MCLVIWFHFWPRSWHLGLGTSAELSRAVSAVYCLIYLVNNGIEGSVFTTDKAHEEEG